MRYKTSASPLELQQAIDLSIERATTRNHRLGKFFIIGTHKAPVMIARCNNCGMTAQINVTPSATIVREGTQRQRCTSETSPCEK